MNAQDGSHTLDFTDVPALEGVPEAELVWLAGRSSVRSFEAGEVVFAQDAPAEELMIVLSGRLELSRGTEGKESAYLSVLAGEVTGLLPYSRMVSFGGTGRAALPTRVATVHARHFPEMHTQAPETVQRLVNLMLDRTREFTRLSEQQEKLVSLGTMAAGLAHELNNPAAAAKRAAQTLVNTLQAFDEHSSKLLSQVMLKELPPGGGDPFQPIYDAMTLQSPAKNALEASALEDELADWLAEQGVAEPWDAAATFVAGGFSRDLLEPFTERITPDKVRDFLTWVPRDVEMRLLARELTESTRRISELVVAMKAYSYMDQAQAKEPTDLHGGLDTTLSILNYKLRQKELRVLRDYGELPLVPAFGGELNQVWTNLLDNAIYASPVGGTLRVRTSLEPSGAYACVEIADSGPGIPEAALRRIFEPFFTTKGVGEGTGLGLDISQRIVARRHGGSVRVDSKPGDTRFTVRLPLEL